MKIQRNQIYKCIKDYDFDCESNIKIKVGESVFVSEFDKYGITVIYHDHNLVFLDVDSFLNHFTVDVELKPEKNECWNVLSNSQVKIANVLDAMKDLLIYKNRKYGDSALHPNNVFYKGDSTNSILIRLDDKLGRIKNNDGDLRVNDVCDLIGYLTLLLVSMGVDISEIEKLKD